MCGKQFESEHGAKYCSDACKLETEEQKRKEQYQNKKPEKESKICGFCSNEFIPKGRSDTVYCSPKCQTDAKARRKNIELTERICVVCGTKFMPVQNKQICCSKECVQRNHYEKNKEKRKQQAKEWRQNNLERVKELDRRKRERNKELYKQISDKHHDETRFGGNRQNALERDGHKCVICGATENLAVHHKDESGQTDNPNNNLDNLITICSGCHTKLHNPRLDTTPHVIKTCPVCGKEIRVSQARIDDGHGKYCSVECADKAKITKVAITCQYCGKEFGVTPSRLKRGVVKYCSMDCRKAAGYAWTSKDKS